MQKYNYTTIGAVVSIVILVVGFIGPWYTISTDSSLGKASIDIGLLDTTLSGETDIIDSAGSFSVEQRGINNTMYIALITIFLAFITLLAILGKIFGFGEKNTIQKIGEISGFSTFIAAIITILYYVMNPPETPDLTMIGITSGLGWGFYLFFVGAIVLILTNLWSRIARAK